VLLEKVMCIQDVVGEEMWSEVHGCDGGLAVDAGLLGCDTVSLSR
jgi:hypothetical protein